MTTFIILNIVIAAIGIGLVAGVMRFGYLLSGGAFERSDRVDGLPTSEPVFQVGVDQVEQSRSPQGTWGRKEGADRRPLAVEPLLLEAIHQPG